MPGTIRAEGEALRRVARLMGHITVEKATHRKARRLGQVPGAPWAVTSEWLTAALCGSCPEAEVTGFRIRDRSSGTSSRWGMTVDYNEAGRAAGLPRDVFAKSTSSFSQRLIQGMAEIVAVEIGFYRDIRPYLQIETPTAYYADLDDRSWRSIVLVEDIAVTRGATFSTTETAVSREQMQHMLGDMASYHAQYWNSPALDLLVQWLKTPAKHVENITRFIGMRERARVGMDRAGDVIPAVLRDRFDDLLDALGRAVELASRGDRTFVHGDCHLGNTFTTASGRMGLADWQACVKGGWAHDVAYLMTSGLAIEDRRAWERDLLSFYLDGLARNGGPTIPFDEGWRAYRQQPFYGLFAWLITIGRSAIQPRMQPDELSRLLIGRITNAVVDNDCLSSHRLP